MGTKQKKRINNCIPLWQTIDETIVNMEHQTPVMPRNPIDQVNDRLTTSYIAQKLGLSYSTIQRVLRALKQKGLVQRVGSDKTGSWKVKD